MKTVSAALIRLVREAWWVARSKKRLKSTINTPLYANSIYLMMNAAANAFLGFVFWIVVARFYAAEDLGFASALLATATLLSHVGSLGLGMGLIRFLRGAGSEAPKLVNSCLTLSGLVATGLGAIFLAGLPLWSPALSFVREDSIFIGAFILLVATTTILERLAEVFIALRRTRFVLLQYTVANLIKLTLVFVLASHFTIFSIFTSVLIGVIIALGAGILLFLPRVMPDYRPLPNLRALLTRQRFLFSFTNYISQVFWNIPTWLLPIMVVNLLGGQSNAYFYITWSIAMLLFAIPYSVSNALFAEGSHQDDQLKSHVTRSLKFMVLLIPMIAVMLLAGGKILLLFGSEYSLAGEKVLRVLSISAIPLAVNVIYLGIARVRSQLKEIILLSVGVAIGSLTLSYVLIPSFGIMGPGIGWLTSNTVAASIVLPKIVILLRSEDADGRALRMPTAELNCD